MSNKIDLSQAERRALGLSMVDGIWDVFMGLFFFLQASVDPIESLVSSRLIAYLPIIIYFPLGLLSFIILKRRVSSPRIGLVKTSARTNQQELRLLILVGVIVVFTLLVFIGTSLGLFEQLGWKGGWLFDWGIDLVFGLLTFAVFSLLAYSLIAPRYYLYGALLGAAMLLTGFLRENGEWISSLPMMLAGVTMIAGGSVRFNKFLKQYPLSQEGDAGG